MKTEAAPQLRHVTVQNSGTAGVAVADDGSAFGGESTTLSVTGSKGYAVRIGANQASTLPATSTFSSNGFDAVELQGNVSRTQTWPKLTYDVNNTLMAELQAVLTLLAGTKVRFGPAGGMLIGEDAGGLVVQGSEQEPVRFTSLNETNPSPGSWQGVHLARQGASNSRISHAIFEYAGGNDIGPPGNLSLKGNFSTTNPTAFHLDHVTVQKSSRYGLFMEYGTKFTPDSTVLNALDNGSHAAALPPDIIGLLPSGSTITGSVEVRQGVVTSSQTWPKRTYVFSGLIIVGYASKPQLTLLPGTELRFSQDTGIYIGRDTGPGVLVAEGTATETVRFVGTTPTQGHWRGLHFHDASGSKLNHVVVSNAGIGGMGNVNVYTDIGAFVTNSELSNSSGCGLTRSATVATDFTAAALNNAFTGNTGGAQCTN